MSSGEDREKNEYGERDKPKLWPAIIYIACSYAAQYARHQQRRPDPLAHRIGHWTRVAAISTACAAVLAGITAAVFWCQLNAMQAQLTEMRAEQRPWLAINKVDPESLSISNLGPSMMFTLDVENSGKLPALHAFTEARIEPGPEGVLLEVQKRICDAISNSPIPKDETKRVSRTIFPSQKTTLQGFPAPSFAKFNVGPTGLIAMYLVGCLFYDDPSGGGHRTGFIYEIIRKDAPNPNFNSAFPATDAEYKGEAVTLRHGFIGDGPAN